MPRRRLIIYSLLAFAVILAAAILFIVTFDANRYLTEIEAALSEKIERPVRIGGIETTLLPETVVVLSDVQVGDAQDSFIFRADRLTLKPRSKRLIVGDLHFTEVIAESPELLATLDALPETEGPPSETEREPPVFTIKKLTASNASWHLTDERRPESPRSYSGEETTIEASGITASRIETLNASGTGTLTRAEDKTELSLQGRIEANGLTTRRIETLEASGTGTLTRVQNNAELLLEGRIEASGLTTRRLETLNASGTGILTRPQDSTELSLQGRVEAGGLAPRRVESLEASGILARGEDSAELSLRGHLVPQDDKGWRHSDIALKIDTAPLGNDLLALVPLFGHTLKGPATLALDLRGTADSGIDVTTRLSGKQLSLRKAGTGKELWSSDAVTMTASLKAGEERFELRDISLGSGDLSLNGRLLARQNVRGILLEAAVEDAALPLELVRSDNFAVNRMLHLDAGEFAFLLTDARLPGLENGPPPDNMPQPGSLKVDGAGRIEPQEAEPGRAGSIPFRLAGTVSKLSAEEPHLDAKITTTLSETNLPELTGKLQTGKLDFGGEAEVLLKLYGAPSAIYFDIDADLTGLTLKSGQLLSKEGSDPGHLRLRGQRQPDGWRITDSTLDLPPVTVTGVGRLRQGTELLYDLSLELARCDLAEAHTLVPILRKIDLSGELAGKVDLTPAGPVGTFKLYRVGLPVPGRLAELNHLSGTVKLDGRQLEAPELRALLGESPIHLSLEVEDLRRPRAVIHLESPSMRASDLIFSNRQAYFRDLKADFVISADGVHLVDVRTRLAGGTVARVEGTIAPLASPDTMLAIDADYGNIDEVIALFRRSSAEPGAQKKKKGSGKAGGKIQIDITAREGRFSSLEFTDAEGFLVISDGRMTIHPLSFHSGNGYFTGMVLRDASGEPPHKLKISGHAEDFNAETLYSQQLKHQGMITGKLRGDFYLEGIEGKEHFLKSSRGAFNVKIDGGVLLRFKVLSKIFSILNVSQIFNFKLPDTSSRGMPYDKLMATVRLKEGVLETDDLFIDSDAMNMTAVGNLNLLDKTLDLIIGVKPLQTVDKIISNIPIAGWLLTGEEKALITTHFEVTGSTGDPKVRPIPISSVSDKVKGIFRRIFGLPEKIIEDVEELFD